MNDFIVPGCECQVNSFINGRRQNIAIIVISMLADEVDAARRSHYDGIALNEGEELNGNCG